MVTFSKIGIVGAGISGIAAAKQLRHLNPIIFEATADLGGVWKHCSYKSTKLQTPRCDYEFSDFPWAERDNSSFPSYQEILDYLHSYAVHFAILELIKFSSKVVEIRYLGNQHDHRGNFELNGEPMWEVAVRTNESDDVEWYAFEFLVICTGKYGDIPIIPKFPNNKGPEVFKGQVMHSSEYCKLDQDDTVELLKDKKVAVIGYKKSAIDLAVECAKANQGPKGKPCTMVVRTLHWTVPHYSVWGLPFSMFYSTRASQFLHERPNQGFLRNLFCTLVTPVKKAVSKVIESYLVWKLPLKKFGLKPEHPFEEDYGSCQMAILPEEFFEEAEKGMIEFKRASNWNFWEGGLQFDDSSKLDADVVIYATGFDGKKKIKTLLPEPFCSLLETEGMMPLYRGTIHPLIPNMAFLGYIESVANLHTAEIRSIWLSRLVDGKFKLPSIEEMLKQTRTEMEIMRRTTRFYKRSCISTFSINHTDEICEEMGWKSWRKNNWLAEAFSPYNSQDYREIIKN